MPRRQDLSARRHRHHGTHVAFTFGKPLFNLSTESESNDPLVATLEKATVAPGLMDLNFKLEDAAPGSGAERIVAFINGPMGIDNPQRQGLNSALGGDKCGPLNRAGGLPTINLDYSPIWDLMPVKWTNEAIEKGYRSRVTDLTQVYSLEEDCRLTGPEGGPIESSGLGINGPVVYIASSNKPGGASATPVSYCAAEQDDAPMYYAGPMVGISCRPQLRPVSPSCRSPVPAGSPETVCSRRSKVRLANGVVLDEVTDAGRHEDAPTSINSP